MAEAGSQAPTFNLRGPRLCHILAAPVQPLSSDLRHETGGISLASFGSALSEMAVPSTYNEPTVMWRMRHADGRHAQAVIDPTNGATRVVWYVNDYPVAVRNFADWTAAIAWTERLRAQQWTVGWRLTDDIPSPPATNAS
jgi:hypothetical protein